MGPKKEAPRRGSTNTSSADAQYLSTEQSSSSKLPGDRKNLTKHRVVQHGIWSPAGAGTRIIYAANSDAGCSLDGQRKTNQDSFVISVPDPKGKTALFGVFDGHGENGHLVSRNCIAQFPTMYQNALTKRGDPSAAVKSAYIELDQHCNGECDCSQSGTTAVTSYFTLEKEGKVNVQTAWAGDSRAVMGSAQAKGAMTSTDLSDDHKPDRPDEMARIQRAGGIVEPVFDENGDPAGPHRVWYLAQVAPGLAMGRSIGDAVGAMVRHVPQLLSMSPNPNPTSPTLPHVHPPTSTPLCTDPPSLPLAAPTPHLYASPRLPWPTLPIPSIAYLGHLVERVVESSAGSKLSNHYPMPLLHTIRRSA